MLRTLFDRNDTKLRLHGMWSPQARRAIVGLSLALLGLLLAGDSRAEAQSRGWKGIIPFVSRCEDVKRMLRVAECPELLSFEGEDAYIQIRFSSGLPCDPKWPHVSWKVPGGTVLEIRVRPKSPLPLQEVEWVRNGFSRQAPADGERVLYVNDELGITYETFNKEVLYIIHGPSQKDLSLLCDADTHNNEIELCSDARPVHTVQITGESAEHMLEFLSAFLDTWKAQHSGAVVGLVSYGGRVTYKNEALGNAELMRSNLIKLGIHAQNIVTVDGGYREDPEVDIFLLEERCQPAISPTVHPSQVSFESTPHARRRANP